MKYFVQQLIQNEKVNHNIDGVISYKDKVDGKNFLDIEDVDVYGTYSYDKYKEQFTFYLTITTKLVIPSAISLKPVEVLVDFDTDLYYTFKVVNDDSFLIIGNEINLDDEVWGEILLHLPSRVTLEGEEYVEEDDQDPDNPFSSFNN